MFSIIVIIYRWSYPIIPIISLMMTGGLVILGMVRSRCGKPSFLHRKEALKTEISNTFHTQVSYIHQIIHQIIHHISIKLSIIYPSSSHPISIKLSIIIQYIQYNIFIRIKLISHTSQFSLGAIPQPQPSAAVAPGPVGTLVQGDAGPGAHGAAEAGASRWLCQWVINGMKGRSMENPWVILCH